MTLKKKGDCQILEPLDNFKLTIPEENLGQAMGDSQRMNGEVKSTINTNGMLLLTGVVPTNEIQNYSKQLCAYTHSQGYLEYQTIGYQPSHQQTALRILIMMQLQIRTIPLILFSALKSKH